VVEDPLDYAWGIVGHLTGVMNSDELRAAHQEMQPLVVKTKTKIAQSAVLFAAINQELFSSSHIFPFIDVCCLVSIPANYFVLFSYRKVDTKVGIGEVELDEAQKRVIKGSLTSMRLSGVGLEGEEKDSFNKNKVRTCTTCPRLHKPIGTFLCLRRCGSLS
jgi:oligopeptidase A